MGRFVAISALILLLGTLGAVRGEAFWPNKPKAFYPVSPNEGCVMDKYSTLCPDKLTCYADSQFPLGGQCECERRYLKYPKKLPFTPDSEWDESGFTASDCASHTFAVFVASCFWLVNIAMSVACFHTNFLIIQELSRAKAFKWNASGTACVFIAICAFSMILCSAIFVSALWEIDRWEFGYRNIHYVYSYLLFIPNIMYGLEIVITWIDLYDRTKKMSKSTSRGLKTLRYLLRFLGVVTCILFFIVNATGDTRSIYFSIIGIPVIQFVTVFIGKSLILKTLCPDRKDVTNPNWKMSEAIRRGANYSMGCSFAYFCNTVASIVVKGNPVVGLIEPLLYPMFYLVLIIHYWSWTHYLIFGYRKHLARFANEKASAFFGFSTIGLNKTLTTASSKMSTMSSAISSRSSAAPPTDD